MHVAEAPCWWGTRLQHIPLVLAEVEQIKLDMKTVFKRSLHWWDPPPRPPSNHQMKKTYFSATSAVLLGQQCVSVGKYLSLLEVREQSMWEDLDALTFFYYPTTCPPSPPNLSRSCKCVSLCYSIEDISLVNILDSGIMLWV